MKHLNYWGKLQLSKMLSLQRMLERYRVLYVWKTLEGLVPNCGVTEGSTRETRLGRKCKIPSINMGSTAAVKTIKEQTFQVNGPQLFNTLPKYLRNMTKCTMDDFKERLDLYLGQIPDEPSVPGLTPGACSPDGRPSNSLLHQRPAERLQGGLGGLRTRPAGPGA